MILAGYAAILGYIFLLIFALGPLVKKISNVETSRKTIHIMLFVVWILLDVFFKDTIHQIIIPIIFIILNLLSYRFGIYQSVERSEGNHLGTVYFALVITAVMTFVYFFPQYYYCSGIAVLCLTFGDGFAALVGYNLPSRSIRHGKSLAGFLACWIASAVSVFLFTLAYPVELTALDILVIGGVTAILELVELGLDNFSVTVSGVLLSAGLLTQQDGRLCTAVLLAVVVFLPVFLSGSIDYYGSLLAMGIVFSYYYFGGVLGITVLLCCYSAIAVISVIRKKVLGKKGSGRGFLQILINGGLGTLAVIAYGFTGKEGLLIVSIVAIGGCFIDSVSSDIGSMSRKPPVDILRRKPVPAGISGGVSLLGTLSALLAAILIGAVLVWQCRLTLTDGLILTALLFGQSVLDSILGSGVQVKYLCSKCGCLTEKKQHCGEKTLYCNGIRWIDNNAVNLISSAVVTAAAAVIFWG